MEQYESLRSFVHLARSLHFGRTSRERHISPSALSRSIQRLEREVGAALFVRDRRTVALAREGRAFRDHAEAVLASWDELREQLSGQGELRGTLAVFCTVTASQSILPDVLGRFREAHPAVHIELETGYAASALDVLLEGGVDVAVAALPPRLPSSITSQVLAVTPLVLVAPASGTVSRAVGRRSVDWGSVPMILPPWGLTREHVDRWLRGRRLRPTVYAQIQSHEAILSLVALGCGVGVVPELVLENSPLRHRVRVVNVRPPLAEFHVAACTLRRTLSTPIVRGFWDTLVA